MRSFSFYETARFDPASLAAIGLLVGGLGGAATAATSIFGPKPTAPSMPAPAPPIQSPTGSPNANSQTGPGPSFLAAAATPQQPAQQKSLLGG